MSAPDLVVPVDVAVVDPDLLWRVEVMNALDGLMVKDVVTVLGAMDHLTPGHPAVLVLGPAGVDDYADQLLQLRVDHPGVRVVAVEGLLVESELGDLSDVPRLSLVPDLPQPAGPEPTDPEPTHREPADPEGLINRRVPGGTSLDDLVVVVREELAIARGREHEQGKDTTFRALAETRIIVVTSAKGGDGATTVAANLAAALATHGLAIGLVEGDPTFGDLPLVLAMPIQAPGLATDPETGIRLVMPERPRDPFAPIQVDLLLDQLSQAEPPFDIVVIDAPPSIADRSGLARMADHLLVVCSSNLSSIKNGVILIDVLQGHENLSVVVNRVGRRGLPLHELEGTLQADVVAQLPYTAELVVDRPDQPPALASRKTALAQQLDSLALELLAANRRV